jgi:zinc protease
MLMIISRRLILVLLLVGAVCNCAPLFAQSADEVIEKHLTALGGRPAIEKIKSRVMKGTITLTTPVGNLTGPMETYNQQPNKARTFIQLDLTGVGLGKVIQDQRFDGTTGYVIDTMQGNRDITGDQLEVMKNSSFPNVLLNYKQMGATVELGEKEKVNNRDAFVLIIKPKSGPVARQYIDAETYMPIKTVIKINVPQIGGDLEQTTEMSDFRDVDGVKVPFEVKTSSAIQTVTVKVSTIEHNIPIDPTNFSKPDANAGK